MNYQQLRTGVKRWFKRSFFKKDVKRNIHHRFYGLDPLFQNAEGRTVLDVGMFKGLISYEFVRRGAKLVHGIEKDKDKVRFCRELFDHVPIPNRFWVFDVTRGLTNLEDALNQHYDIVLFLGVYHHIKSFITEKEIQDMILFMLKRAGTWFAVRSPDVEELRPLIQENGFSLVFQFDKIHAGTGKLDIYKRHNT
jgi:2-polyprenyl-3-methyl-5-hydroxy-6-metoxy-1,4-benzoquinol methylase